MRKESIMVDAANEKRCDEVGSLREDMTCRMIDNGCELCCSQCDKRHSYDDDPNYCHNCGAKVVG